MKHYKTNDDQKITTLQIWKNYSKLMTKSQWLGLLG